MLFAAPADPSPGQDDQPQRPNGRGVGAPYLMIATIGIGVVLGLWLDRTYGTRPRWILVCSAVSLVLAFYHIIRESRR